MRASPDVKEIVDALKKSGYLMEQEVATQLEALNFHVSTNLRTLRKETTRMADLATNHADVVLEQNIPWEDRY